MGDERKRRRENSREPPGYDPDTFDWEVRAHGLCPLPTPPLTPTPGRHRPRNSTLIASSQSTDHPIPLRVSHSQANYEASLARVPHPARCVPARMPRGAGTTGLCPESRAFQREASRERRAIIIQAPCGRVSFGNCRFTFPEPAVQVRPAVQGQLRDTHRTQAGTRTRRTKRTTPGRGGRRVQIDARTLRRFPSTPSARKAR